MNTRKLTKKLSLGFRCFTALFLLAVPVIVQAQFTLSTNNNSITIIGYTGPGGLVVIPNTTNGYAITGIGDYAFAYSTNLTGVSIPSTITNIGVGPFLGCAGLTNISVAPANHSYSSSTNGVLFDTAQGTLIAYPEGLTNGTYTIPKTVRSIGQYAFASCFHLTSVTVTNCAIGEFAFSQCTGLAFVSIQNNVTNIGAGAFTYCAGLTNVVFAVTNTAPNIGGFAFAFCPNLTSAYFEGIHTPADIGNAFYGDANAVVYYPPGTTGWGATFGGATTAEATPPFEFQYFTRDGSITIEQYDFHQTSLEIGVNVTVAIPGTIDGIPVTTIGNDAFISPLCPTNVIIPSSITNMQGAIQNASVFSVTFASGTTTIPRYALDDCDSVTTVNLPDSLTSIGEGAFYSCWGLTNFTIPNSVTNIGDSALQGCSSLAHLTIPDSVTSIGRRAFSYCGLTNITIPNSITSIEYGAFDDCSKLISIAIPDSVTNIGLSAFQFCTGLASVTIPSSVTSIGDSAFEDCGDLNSVTIADGVTNIGAGAFQNCESLVTITIPRSVTSIGQSAFESCTNLTSAYFEGNAPPDNGNAFSFNPTTIVYYLSGTTGWGATFGGAPTELWNPQATSFVTAGNQFGFNITGPTNATVVVEACTNLANPVWLPVSTNALSASGTSSFNDPQWVNFPMRFYRFSAP